MVWNIPDLSYFPLSQVILAARWLSCHHGWWLFGCCSTQNDDVSSISVIYRFAFVCLLVLTSCVICREREKESTNITLQILTLLRWVHTHTHMLLSIRMGQFIQSPLYTTTKWREGPCDVITLSCRAVTHTDTLPACLFWSAASLHQWLLEHSSTARASQEALAGHPHY